MLYVSFWMIPRRLNFFLPMKMEQIECSETSAYKIQTPGNHPEENIQQSGVFVWRVKKQERHSLIDTVTVNKQIGAQVRLIVRDKQQLLITINKQRRIISVFVSRQLRQIWTFRGPPT
jgi:hypothetical protein